MLRHIVMKETAFMESGWFAALVFSALALLATAFFVQLSMRGSTVPPALPIPNSVALPR